MFFWLSRYIFLSNFLHFLFLLLVMLDIIFLLLFHLPLLPNVLMDFLLYLFFFYQQLVVLLVLWRLCDLFMSCFFCLSLCIFCFSFFWYLFVLERRGFHPAATVLLNGEAYEGSRGVYSTVSPGKGFGSQGKQHFKRTASETQSHNEWSHNMIKQS